MPLDAANQSASLLTRRSGAASETQPEKPCIAEDVHGAQAPQMLTRAQLSVSTSSPHVLILGVILFCAVSHSRTGDTLDVSKDISSGKDASRPVQSPPLRGCRGSPVEFQWLIPQSTTPHVHAIAGTPLRTEVLAFDAQGRRARATDCSKLLLSVDIGGHARLSQNRSQLVWEDGKLFLDIEDEIAEDVDVELRIENPILGANRTLHRLRIKFTAGRAHKFDVNVRPANSALAKTMWPLINGSNSAWSTHLVLEVILFAWDEFGNVVLGPDIVYGSTSYMVSGSGAAVVMGTGSLALSENAQAHVLVRGVKAGSAELWLASMGDERRTLKAWNLVFVDPFEATASSEGKNRRTASLSTHDAEWQPLASEVRNAFLHAWRGYRRYAWGADDLKPLSKTGRDSFGNIGMTVLDSLTTLHLMGLDKEFEQGAEFVNKHLDFDSADREVSVFELTIRALGGLLGAHSLTGRSIFLQRAVELADRLLPALNSSSGLPMPRWNIARQGGTMTGEPTVLAEAGSLQLEFRYLTTATGNMRYGKAADACFNAIQAVGVSGIIPVQLTPPDHTPPQAMYTRYALGALADSYYEYLLKQWIQSPTEIHFKDIWLAVMKDLPSLVRPKPPVARSYGKPPKFKLVEIEPGGATIFKMDHLSCFVPGMIALGLLSLPSSDLIGDHNATWRQLAEGLTESCVDLWTSTASGLAPEFVLLNTEEPFDTRGIAHGGEHSFLRPETAESLFYLYRLTSNKKYREWGRRLFRAIIASSKVDAGFASVANVERVPTTKLDDMQSFVMAETFKYLFLLFSPKEALDLDKFVLNTEAHPLRRPGPW